MTSSPVLIERDTLQCFEDFVSGSVESPIVCVKCDKISTKNRKDSKRVMFSIAGLHILQHDKKSKYAAPRKIYWLSLLTMTETTHKSIIFKFSDEKVEIFHKEHKRIGKLIADHLHSFMMEQELPVISLEGQCSPAFDEKKVLNPFTRFVNVMLAKVSGITGTELKKYISFFENGKEEISLSNFQKVIANNLDDFLRCIQYFRNVTKIVFDCPISEKEIEPILEFLKYTKKIRTIVLFGCLALRKNPDSLYISDSVKCLECVNCLNVTPINLQFLINLINNNSFDSVSFTNSLNSETFSELFNNIRESKSVKSFYIHDVSGFDLNQFKIFAENLENITLLNTGIEISEIINSIESFRNLKVLNLSSNCVKKQIDKVEFPKTLEKLILNQVVWKNSSLSDLFNILQQVNDHHITLSFNDISFYGCYWDDFFEDLALCSPIDIVELNWNNNRLSSNFFKYIKNCQHLRRLSIFNCLKTNISVSYYLGEYLIKTKTLKKINISVDDCEIQEAEASTLFTSISRNKTLSSISMCGFRCNKIMLELLINCLLENRRITELDFDFKNVDNHSFEEFLDRLIVRGPPLLIKKEFVIHYLTSRKIIEKYHILIRGDKSIKPPYETVSTDFDDLLISGQLMSVKKPASKNRTKSSTISIKKSDLLSFREKFDKTKNKVNRIPKIPTTSVNMKNENSRLPKELTGLIPPIDAEQNGLDMYPSFLQNKNVQESMDSDNIPQSILTISPSQQKLLPESLKSNIPEKKTVQPQSTISDNYDEEKSQLNSLVIGDSINREQIPSFDNKMYIPTIHEVSRNRSQTICESPNPGSNSIFQQFREIAMNQRQIFHNDANISPISNKFNFSGQIIPPIQAEPQIVRKRRSSRRSEQNSTRKRQNSRANDLSTSTFYQEEINTLHSYIFSLNQPNKKSDNPNDNNSLTLNFDSNSYYENYEDSIQKAKTEFNVDRLLELIHSN